MNGRARLTSLRPSTPALDSVGFFLLIGSLSAAAPAAMDMYVPALPRVAVDLHASTSLTQLTVAFYLVGLGLGQMVFGQISDVVGRRPPLLAGLLLFVVASALCASTSSLVALIAGRLLQGFSGASGMVIGRAVVRDLYGMTASARYYSRLTLIYGVAPIIAPMIGSGVLLLTSWHGIFVVISGFGLVLLLGATLWFPETLPKDRRRSGSVRSTAGTFHMLLRDRRFVGCALTLGLSTGAVVAYVATATFVIQDEYGASTSLFAGLFGINALSMVAGSQINAFLVGRFPPAALVEAGLWVSVAGACGMLVVGLAGLGLIALEISLVLLLGSWGLVQGNILAIGLAEYGAAAGSGSALLGLMQFTLGAVFAPLAGLGGSHSGTALGAVTLTCVAASAASAQLLVLRGKPLVGIQPEPLDAF